MVMGVGGLHVDDLRQAYLLNAGKFLVRQIKVHKVDGCMDACRSRCPNS